MIFVLCSLLFAINSICNKMILKSTCLDKAGTDIEVLCRDFFDVCSEVPLRFC